jgi:nucleoside-diphosphate-sugar epimerase
MRIAVTGGLGRLGRYFVEASLSAHDVLATDRVPPDGTLPAVQADLTDLAALRSRRGPSG